MVTKLWSRGEEASPSVSCQSSLTYHGCAVNTIRFSRSDMLLRSNRVRELLASGADGGELIIWKLHPSETNQSWKVHQICYLGKKPVDGEEKKHVLENPDELMTETIPDETTMVTKLWSRGEEASPSVSCQSSLTYHGCAVNTIRFSRSGNCLPQEQTVRVKSHLVAKMQEASLSYGSCILVKPISPGKFTKSVITVKTHLFRDEILPSFFRDGSFLLIPSGSFKLFTYIRSYSFMYFLGRTFQGNITTPCHLLFVVEHIITNLEEHVSISAVGKKLVDGEEKKHVLEKPDELMTETIPDETSKQAG
ncbi:hypothetical protein Bca52824_009804 [Brassica carinata]|uniref:Uncharacterized protein n=1 Tax=Brassica carinata TaxID=52824 RepID=A0A8X7WBJ8_BRACI|nr:hypothetical protein Bca52824_009804 [Brassica carinata]